MHDCTTCGMACACDGEDAYGAPQPSDCTHVCDEEPDDVAAMFDRCRQCGGTGRFDYGAITAACDDCGGDGAQR